MHWQRIKRCGSLTPKILKNGPRMEYPEEYKSWASMKGFAANRELASKAGRKGGLISRRGKSKVV